MAAESDATCESDPNFAVICGFLEKFGGTCGLANIDFLDLQQMLENTHEVPQELVELHVKLLRKARKSVSQERWEKALINLCHSYCSQDAWELERFGYKKARISSKLRILKQLLEMQFDFNAKFKNEINKMSANELRSQPLGRDKLGCAYWYQADDNCQVRVYKDDPDEETWTLVAKDREGVLSLISELGSGDSVKIGTEVVSNEDSSSIEIEKPMIDTGQNDSPKLQEDEKTLKVEDNNGNIKISEQDENADKLESKEEQDSNESFTDSEEKITELSENNVGLDLSVKPPVDLRIKSLEQLVVSKPDETSCIKDKYMREDKVQTTLRMAVESATFDNTNPDLDESEEEEELVEDCQPYKKPKLCRPTLLNNKFASYQEEYKEAVSDEIEEPVMVVKGHGNGTDNYSSNQTDSPIVGDAIEEPTFYVVGLGNGRDSQTGNEINQEKDNSEQLQNKNDDGNMKDNNSIKDSDISKKLAKESSPSKVYKLGTIIDVKTDHNKVHTPSKKISRWDVSGSNSLSTHDSTNPGQVQTLISKWEKLTSEDKSVNNDNANEEHGEDNDNTTAPSVASKQKMFFFGPQSVGSSLSYSAYSFGDNSSNKSTTEEPNTTIATKTNLDNNLDANKSIESENILKEKTENEIVKDESVSDLKVVDNQDEAHTNKSQPDNMPSAVDNSESCDNKNVPYDNNVKDVETNIDDKETSLESQGQTLLEIENVHSNCNLEETNVNCKIDDLNQDIDSNCPAENVKAAPEIDSNKKIDEPSSSSQKEEITLLTDEEASKSGPEMGENVHLPLPTNSKELDLKEFNNADNQSAIDDEVKKDRDEDKEKLIDYEGAVEVVEEPVVKKYVAPLGDVNEEKLLISYEGAVEVVEELVVKKYVAPLGDEEEKPLVDYEGAEEVVEEPVVKKYVAPLGDDSEESHESTATSDPKQDLVLSQETQNLDSEKSEVAAEVEPGKESEIIMLEKTRETDKGTLEEPKLDENTHVFESVNTKQIMSSITEIENSSKEHVFSSAETVTALDEIKDNLSGDLVKTDYSVTQNLDKEVETNKEIVEKISKEKEIMQMESPALEINKPAETISSSLSKDTLIQDISDTEISPAINSTLSEVDKSHIDDNVKIVSTDAQETEFLNIYKENDKNIDAVKPEESKEEELRSSENALEEEENVSESIEKTTPETEKESLKSVIGDTETKSFGNALIAEKDSSKVAATVENKTDELPIENVNNLIAEQKLDDRSDNKVNETKELSSSSILIENDKAEEPQIVVNTSEQEKISEPLESNDPIVIESTDDKSNAIVSSVQESEANLIIEENNLKFPGVDNKNVELKKMEEPKIKDDIQNDDVLKQPKEIPNEQPTSLKENIIKEDVCVTANVVTLDNIAEKNDVLEQPTSSKADVCVTAKVPTSDNITEMADVSKQREEIFIEQPTSLNENIIKDVCVTAKVATSDNITEKADVAKQPEEILVIEQPSPLKESVVNEDVCSTPKVAKSSKMQNILLELKNKAAAKEKNKSKEQIDENLKEQVPDKLDEEVQSLDLTMVKKPEPEPAQVMDVQVETAKSVCSEVKETEPEQPETKADNLTTKEDFIENKNSLFDKLKDAPTVETLHTEKSKESVDTKAEDKSEKPCVDLQDEDQFDEQFDPLSTYSSRSNSVSDSDTTHLKENIEIKTVEDFEDSIKQNEINSQGSKNEIEIKTVEDFEDSIQVKKIRLSDAIAEKNAAAKQKTESAPRRTRASARLSAQEQPESNVNVPKKSEPLTLANFQLDTDVSAPIIKTNRKREHSISPETVSAAAGSEAKRPKTRGRRSMDAELRKSIEIKKNEEKSSSEDENDADGASEATPDVEKQPKIRKRRGRRKGWRKALNFAKTAESKPEDDKEAGAKEVGEEKSPKQRRRKTRLVMGLELPLETDVTEESSVPLVRQSRRIAQIKIKEEAERRKLEEIALCEIQKKHKSKKDDDKDYKFEKKSKNKNVIIDDETSVELDEEVTKKKKRRKHKDISKLFDETNPWRSSSDSSTSNEDDDEEEEIAEYSDEDEKLVFKSDHEFSPESDLEDSAEIQPLKRARTVKKESDAETEMDDYNCQKCGKSDHPEWILLCDGCDNGWHCSCLRPPLLVIPEGDWYCPPCQHGTLIKNLQTKLEDFDKKLNKRELEVRRKERLAYVGISLDNVLPQNKEEKKVRTKEDESYSESEDESGDSAGSDESSESSSDSDEPIYQLRQRRQAHSYRFNDYDELINSAIQDEMDTVKPTVYQSRGKDISTIINAESKEEKETPMETEPKPEEEELPPVVPKNNDVLPLPAPASDEKDESDEEIKPVRKPLRTKKHRKLNSLDISSEDDPDSDEDFKGNSSDEDDDDFDDEFGSESSEDYGRKGRGGGAIRRSTRARTSRYDKDFINDDDDDSDEAPRKRKTRSIWDESESEESDRSWGRRKRKASRKTKTSPAKQQKRRSKKKKKSKDDSDAEVYRKKKPKIKFGGLNDDNEDYGRRTRGKKVTYVDALGSDSDEETVKKAPPRIEDSEEEFVLNEEEELENEKDSEEEESEEVDDDDDEPVMKGKPSFSEKLKPTPPMENSVPKLDSVATDQPLLSATDPGSMALNPSQAFEEPTPLEEINKNVEEMDMEMMIEDEEYANKQLQLVAVQIEKERKRKEALKLEQEQLQQQQQQQFVPEPKVPKKRGRKPKNYDQQAGLVTPPATVLPETSPTMNSESNDGDTPRKRRGRGKGKKTLAAEAAAAAAAAVGTTGNQSSESTSRSIDSSPGNTQDMLQGGKLGIATPPQPFSQAQPTPSVITRMLQSQQNPQPYPNSPVGSKFYGSPGQTVLAKHPENAPTPTLPANANTPPNTYVAGAPRGVGVNVPFRPPTANLNYMPRGVQPNIPVPQTMPHIYHHNIEQAAGAAVSMPGRSSPSVIPTGGSSPLATKNATPPPPPYARPPLLRFPPPGMANAPTLGPRSVALGHMQSPRGRLSPHQTAIPPNYHFATFPPNVSEDGIPAPPSSYANAYEQFAAEAQGEKMYEEDGEGEFGGLVSYFSSQREDDLDT